MYNIAERTSSLERNMCSKYDNDDSDKDMLHSTSCSQVPLRKNMERKIWFPNTVNNTSLVSKNDERRITKTKPSLSHKIFNN